MAIWKKLLLGLVVAGGVLFVLLFVLVRLYVTPEKVRDLLQQGLESSLQRPVTLGQVDVSLFSGIKLQGLRVASKNADEALLEASDIELSYDIASLLHGELLLGRIRINNPRLRLVRMADGRLNISDLIEPEKSATQPAAPAAGTEAEKPATTLPLLVRQFQLQGGTLFFVDRKLNPSSPYLYRLENLSVAVTDFSSDQPFPVHVAARLNGAAFTTDLRYGLQDGLQSLRLHLDQLDLVPLLPYVQGLMPGSLGRGTLSSELQLEKMSDGMAIKGQVVLDRLDLGLDSAATAWHWQDARIAFDQDLLYRFADRVLDARKFLVEMDGLRLDYQGKVMLGTPLQVDGDGRLQILDLRQLVDLLPIELQRQVTSIGAAGSLTADVHLEGAANGPAVLRKAQLHAKDLQASFGTLRPALNGTFDYVQDKVTGHKLQVELNGQQLTADLQATQIFAPRPTVTLKISADQFDLNPLLPAADSAQTADSSAQGRPPTRETAALAGPLSLPLDAAVELHCARLLYRKLPLTQVDGRLLLEGNRLNLKTLTAQVAGGRLALDTVATLDKPQLPVSGHYSANDLDLAPVADALLPQGKGSISGRLGSEGRFSAAAGVPHLLDSLNSSGSFDIRDGEIKGSPLFAELARFLTSPEFQVLGFSRFHGTYGLTGPKGTIDAQLESRRAILSPKGNFSLNGPLDLSLATRISPELAARSGVGGKGIELLKDANGWTLLPLKVKGSYSSPRFTIDSRAARKQLKQGVGRELERQLMKKLGGKSDKKNAEPAQKLLDDTLKKLFGQ